MDARRRALVEALLMRHGRTYADDLGIRLEQGTPSVLFRWLCAAILLSARIRAETALAAARALSDQGWTTASKLAGSSWEERTRVLNQAGYGRYDESTSRMLGDTARLALEAYGGDLRKLREAAGRDPDKARALLKRFKGLGDVGADIFIREAQAIWEEFYPFVDRRAADTAGKLGFSTDMADLARRVPRSDLPRLCAALVRTSLAKDHDAVLKDAGARS